MSGECEKMMSITPVQLFQLGDNCSLCEEKAVWFDKLHEKAPCYCDKHFPYKTENDNDSVTK